MTTHLTTFASTAMDTAHFAHGTLAAAELKAPQLAFDDNRDSMADYDASFQTTNTQPSEYTLNDGDTTIDEEAQDDDAKELDNGIANRYDASVHGLGDDDEQEYTASQLEQREKKRRRRTNKDEATVLSAVFEETAFPDVHTRTALAERLNMDLRSVSIWFQNKRQAVKKRASRYGGLEGVAGAHGSEEHDLDVSFCSQDPYVKPTGSAGLKRWASLDDVASRNLASQLPSRAPLAQLVPAVKVEEDAKLFETQRRVAAMMQPAPFLTERKSCAPLLDALRRCKGKSLTRMASLPSIVANKLQDIHDAEPRRDLRELLQGAEALPSSRSSSLQRSASLAQLSTRSSQDEQSMSRPSVTTARVERSFDLPGADSPEPIWKHMMSSSSGAGGSEFSSDPLSENSDKENQQQIRTGLENVSSYEDEEHTLRRIASKRAAREHAKMEQKLSAQGAKYVQEADARVVLQQQRTKDESARRPLKALQMESVCKQLSRVSSALMGRQRSALARVASLDLSAGHDRSKAPGKALMDVRDEFERERQRRITSQRQAEERAAKAKSEMIAARSMRRVNSTPSGQKYPFPQAHGAASSASYHAHGHRGLMDRHMGVSKMPRLPQLVRSASGPLSLYPTSRPLSRMYSNGHMMSSLMTRHLESTTRFGGSTADLLEASRKRQSLQSTHSASSRSSRSSDDSNSDSWTERWAREQRSISVRSSSERDRSGNNMHAAASNGSGVRGAAAAAITGKRVRPNGNVHGDGGFFENDESDALDGFYDDEDAENVPTSAAAVPPLHKKRCVSEKAPVKCNHRVPLGPSTTTTHNSRSPLQPLGASRAGNHASPKARDSAPSAQPSSSPYKRGDERDRLAAETLLGLGWQA